MKNFFMFMIAKKGQKSFVPFAHPAAGLSILMVRKISIILTSLL